MKPLHLALITALLMSSTAALAQHEHPPTSAPAAVAPSEAQESFETLKTLAGSWEGTLTSVPPMKEIEGKRVKVVIRMTSRGNALMHEMTPDRIARRSHHHAVSRRGTLDADALLRCRKPSAHGGGRQIVGRFDLQRTKEASGPFGQ